MGVHQPKWRGQGAASESHLFSLRAHTKVVGSITQPKGPGQSVGVHHPSCRGHAKTWELIIPNLEATPKRGSQSSQLKGPHHHAGGHQIILRHHAKACESIKQVKLRRQSIGVHYPNSRGHAKGVTPHQGVTPMPKNPSTQLESPRQSVGVNHPNSRGHGTAWECITPTRGTMPKCAILSPQL